MKRALVPIIAVAAIGYASACADRAAMLRGDSVALPPIAAAAARRDTLPAEVRTACAEVAASWRTAPNVTVREIADSTAEEWSYDSTSIQHSCAVIVEDSAAFAPADSARVNRDGPAKSAYWRAFARAGWVQLTYSADGPDGSATQYQRGRVRCLLDERWDGGDDGDSTYVPSPFYGQNTSCWWHPRALADSEKMP